MDRKSFLGYVEDKLETPILRRSARVRDMRANKELNELNEHKTLPRTDYIEGMLLPSPQLT